MLEKKTMNNLMKSMHKILEKYSNNNHNNLEKLTIGNVVRLGYLIPEGEKERIQYYEGLIINIQNKGLGKSFTIRRNVEGIGVEQIFPHYSPKIVSIIKKQASKVRRAKLYFLRSLSGKSSRLKIKL
jgi:large subunit ribosomal protein L19